MDLIDAGGRKAYGPDRTDPGRRGPAAAGTPGGRADIDEWMASGLAGLGLGLLLYGLVRGRMALAGAVHHRFGRAGYRALWWLVALLMVLAANLGLLLLRSYLSARAPGADRLPLEVLFAAAALASGGGLALHRARRCR